MLRFTYDQPRADGAITRREWLRIGGLAGLSLSGLFSRNVSNTAANESRRKPRGFGRAKSVILVYCSGGQSQLDTWDPKPNAPADVRSEFAAIRTKLPGVLLCEHMPRLAQLADRYTIVRSMSHEDLDHGSASYLALTGRYHQRLSSNPPPSPNDFPTYGAVLKRVRTTHRFLSDAVHVNGPAYVPTLVAPGQDGGFLGREYEPLVVGDVTGEAVAMPGLDPQPGLPPVRLNQRLTLKETLDQYTTKLGENAQILDQNRLYRTAYEMLSTPRCREAFNLGAESPALRDRYGRHRSGQACLLARRLVEAGVPLVTVIWNHNNRGQDLAPGNTDQYGWDTHNDIFESLKIHLLPRFDESFSALLEDLDGRGLLDDTLVVCLGEFGRAPQIALESKFAGSTPGRKHWASVYSIVMAGAGVRRGTVLGSSDRLGGEPTSERYGPWDVAATMFSALGIDPSGEFVDSLQRPFPITIGRPIEALYA
jgi:hypothetical protein